VFKVGGRLVVMLLLIVKDSRDGSNSLRITVAQSRQLLPQVPKYHTLYRYRGGCNCFNAQQAADNSKGVTSDRTHPITSASCKTAPMKFVAEDCPMSLFVRFEGC
jgi:hypothetical protein